MLEAACSAAQAVILDQVFFSLNIDKFQQFTAMLDAPPSPNPRLERLMAVTAPWACLAPDGKQFCASEHASSVGCTECNEAQHHRLRINTCVADVPMQREAHLLTVNPAKERSNVLVEHSDGLRTTMKTMKGRHPLSILAMVVLPEHLHAI